MQNDPCVSECLLGQDYLEASMFEKAIEHFDKSIALEPTFSTAYCYKGLAYLGMNNFDESIGQSEKGLELILKDNAQYVDAIAMTYMNLALAHRRKNDMEKAIYYIKLFSKMDKSDPKDVEKKLVEIKRKRIELEGRDNVSGNEYLEAEMFEEAIKCFDKSIAENPNDMKGYVDKATALLHMYQFNECINECEKAIEMGNDVNLIAKCYYQMGLSYWKKGDIDKAVSFHKLSNETVPSEELSKELLELEKLQGKRKGIPYRQLAFQHENRGQIELSIENYTKALEHDPSNHNYHFLRALHYISVGNYEACVEDCDKALRVKSVFAPLILMVKSAALFELEEQ